MRPTVTERLRIRLELVLPAGLVVLSLGLAFIFIRVGLRLSDEILDRNIAFALSSFIGLMSGGCIIALSVWLGLSAWQAARLGRKSPFDVHEEIMARFEAENGPGELMSGPGAHRARSHYVANG
jgi:hypothetical protein